MNANPRRRISPLLTAVVAVSAMAVAACGGGSAAPQAGAPPASSHTAAERAATLSWLAKTNQMRTKGDFSALDQVTTGEMRAIYRHEQQHADGTGPAFQLTGLSITIPCQLGGTAIFVAYGDTDVFTLGQALQPAAMVFQRTGSAWKLAAAVTDPSGSRWPALCRQGPAATAPATLAPGRYAPDLAAVLTHAMTGTTPTAATTAPFAASGFLAGPGSLTAQAATWIRQDRRDGATFTAHFTPAPDPTIALPLAHGRGYWLIGFLTQTSTHNSPAGLRKATWPDKTPVATPRPAVVHHQTDTYITTYTATDPPRSGGGRVALDGFFGWPLTSTTS